MANTMTLLTTKLQKNSIFRWSSKLIFCKQFIYLFSDKSRQLTINANEVLSIRSKKIKLHGGLIDPVIVEDEPNHDTPNLLYLYYSYRHNIYYWRVRKAALYFSTTAEKKQWEELLKTLVSNVNGRPKKLLVFINPFGGKRQAKQIYEKQVN